MSPGLKARPVLVCLFEICMKYGKLYCFPSQKKLIYNLERYQDEKKSIATLNRWLRAIEDAGYVKRVRRIRRDKKLGMVFKSTLYKITRKGYALLAKGGVVVWKMLDELGNGDVKKRPGPGIGPVVGNYINGMAPLKNHIARVLKMPVIGRPPGSPG